MQNSWLVKPGVFLGRLLVPPSKSHTMRAIISASLADGKSVITNVLDSPDTSLMIKACISFGAKIIKIKSDLFICGVAGKPVFVNNTIDAGNSGIIYRFITGVASLSIDWVVIDGDESIRKKRSIQPLINALQVMGAQVEFLLKPGRAPFKIKGPIKLKDIVIESIDSQPISALMWLVLCGKCDFVIEFLHCQEQKWLKFSQQWLEQLGVEVDLQHNKIRLVANQVCQSFQYNIPADYSTALYPALAAILTQGKVELLGLVKQDFQPDKIAFNYLQNWGANIDWQDDVLIVSAGIEFSGGELDISLCIDALPALVVAATFAKKPSVFLNCLAAELKESRRVTAMIDIILSMGGQISFTNGSLTINPGLLQKSNIIKSLSDHRLALSGLILALAMDKPITIDGVDCVAKTYPGLVKVWQKCNVEIIEL